MPLAAIWYCHFAVAAMTLLTITEYLCRVTNEHGYVPLVDRVTRTVPLLKYELLILPVHRSSPPVLVGFVLLDLLFSVWRFVDRCLSFFLYGHCVVCPSSIYGFWLPLSYLQTLLHIWGMNIVVRRHCQ